MLKKLNEKLQNTAVYTAVRKEYLNEDEDYLLYMLNNKATDKSKKAKKTKAA